MDLKCEICNVVYPDIRQFLVHTRIHRYSQIFLCPLAECAKKFGSFASFRKHLRFRHIGPDIGPKKSVPSFTCSLAGCGFSEGCFHKIMKHASNHISAGQPVFCPLRCPTRKPFATTNSLRIHKMYAHRGGLKNLDRPGDSVECEKECGINNGERDSANPFVEEDLGVEKDGEDMGDCDVPHPLYVVE